MGQKTHPLGFRIGITQNHRSAWYATSEQYPEFLQEDHLIRWYIEQKLNTAGLSRIQIYRKVEQLEIEIHALRPGVVVGRLGVGIEVLRTELEQLLSKNKRIRLNIIEVTNPDTEAALLCEFITQQLEKRVAYRRAVRQVIQKAQKANVKGIKIQVSGRLNGAEIARSEWVREGRVPLQTLRADIDYSYKTAQTTYGILGVKVWLFKGEKTATTA
uniref:ribosomal protein S3 n=1 Tax=Pseudoerythrocladia kornmannii TaxID=753682 RepID=UPI001FCDFC5F|nr:ribosomal protein S3 [Pseudoerythrocladia kornmannii]UNJ16770.1 ribosomal protein S3 [Pseudoerythrocladia kornmannii]